MLTNKEILQIAMNQSARDLGCDPKDFLRDRPKAVLGGMGEGAKVYYSEPVACNMISYGNCVVASAKKSFWTWC